MFAEGVFLLIWSALVLAGSCLIYYRTVAGQQITHYISPLCVITKDEGCEICIIATIGRGR